MDAPKLGALPGAVMATDIKVPAVGESITEGTISRWFKKDGDSVKADEPLFELETEKATTEIAAPAAGTLRIKIGEGKTVPIGTIVGQIDEKEAIPAEKTRDKKPAADGHRARPAPDGAAKSAPVVGADVAKPVPGAPAQEKLLSPSARRLMDEQGIDIQKVTGTGPRGRVTKEDVLQYVERERIGPTTRAAETVKPGLPPPDDRVTSPAVAPHEAKQQTPATSDRETRQQMSSIRQRIGERLLAAQQSAAILTTFNEADLTAVMALRSQYKESFQKKHNVGLGFMSFFVKAAVEALHAYPLVNAWIDGSDIVYHHYYNIGVAVSTERGLMVPVLRDADRKSFAEIEKQIAELAQKARDGKVTVQDLQGGTFTITNGGVFGSLLSTPILNPPQSAILGMHTIQKRPVVKDDQIVIRPMMYLAMSYDHRLIDGREAVLFLVRVKECIENPERLLLEV
jgi:2-oxoglutarate dehydrogenase E2 component (dihydrolipoamide succinyltransferase)